MAGVRPLTPDDIPRVAELHLQGFPGERPRQAVEEFLANVMFGNPWMDDRMPCLGYEGPGGKLVGCIGIMPRPMVMGGRALRGAVSNNFIVDPDGQPGLAAFALMRTVRSLGADLILGEASPKARDICERLGWVTVRTRSFRWLRPLRPAALGLQLLEGWRLPKGAARMLRPVCRLPDALYALAPGSPLRNDPPDDDPPLDCGRLLELIGHAAGRYSLQPCYDAGSLGWLLETLRRTRRGQSLRAALVPAETGEPAGWYVYYSRPGEMARVLQLGAEPGFQGRVLRHLFHDAWRSGNHAVTGQADPAWMDALVESSCFFRKGGSWMVAHTNDEETRRCVFGAGAFLSRLETEAWITFAF